MSILDAYAKQLLDARYGAYWEAIIIVRTLLSLSRSLLLLLISVTSK
jgi:hypothetical protein